jgi:hypothetical protein
MASRRQDGTYETPVFPWKLRFVSSHQFNMPDKTYNTPFEQFLQTIPVGSTLFYVYAMDKPAELGGQE